jgi:hypothetical protein
VLFKNGTFYTFPKGPKGPDGLNGDDLVGQALGKEFLVELFVVEAQRRLTKKVKK